MQTPFKNTLIAATTSALLALCANAQSTVVLDEQFTTPRLEQNLPGTSAWYSSGPSANVTYTGNGQLRVAQPSGGLNTFLLTYFTDSNPVLLQPGSSIKASFDVSFKNPTDALGGIRVGLLNSGGSRISADNQNFTNALFSNYKGYAAYFNPTGRNGVDNLTIRKRDKVSNTLISSNDPYTNLGAGMQNPNILQADTLYSAVLLVNYSAEGAMTITFSINGMELALGDTSATSLVTSFDTFVILGMNGTVSDLTLANVKIEHSTVIPETSASALLVALAAALGIVAIRRKHNRKA